MGFRNPNGYGCVKKLSGKRRRPFAVYVTVGWDMVDGKAKQRQKALGYYETRPEAMIALADYNKNPYDIDKRGITFEQVYNILFEQKISKMAKSAQSGYTTAYKKCTDLRNMRMVEIRKAHMQRVIDAYREKSRSTLLNLKKLFNLIYTFCLEEDICDKNYSQFITIESEAEEKAKKPFNREEIQTMWANLDWKYVTLQHEYAYMDALLVNLYTGVRIMELLTIKKQDVHLDERWINLHGTKSKAARRIIPIHKKILPLIEKRMAADDTEWLFPDPKGRAFTATQFRRTYFDNMCSQFKMDHTPHEFRHTFATFAAASNMNKVLLKKIIGHSSKDLTEDIYTHVFVADLVSEIDKLDM